MRTTTSGVIALSLCLAVHASAADPPPHLLGVWYGVFETDAGKAEMWMEIAYHFHADAPPATPEAARTP